MAGTNNGIIQVGEPYPAADGGDPREDFTDPDLQVIGVFGFKHIVGNRYEFTFGPDFSIIVNIRVTEPGGKDKFVLYCAGKQVKSVDEKDAVSAVVEAVKAWEV